VVFGLPKKIGDQQPNGHMWNAIVGKSDEGDLKVFYFDAGLTFGESSKITRRNPRLLMDQMEHGRAVVNFAQYPVTSLAILPETPDVQLGQPREIPSLDTLPPEGPFYGTASIKNKPSLPDGPKKSELDQLQSARWPVVTSSKFDTEYSKLSPALQKDLMANLAVLGQVGPQLGRPKADTLYGSKFANIKELRFVFMNQPWRVTFAFDPNRQAILLAMGNKKGVDEKLFYKKLIADSEVRYQAHLDSLVKVQPKK
jgi:hypothetical protein